MKHVKAKELYGKAGYLSLGSNLTPLESGWGQVIDDHKDCEAVRTLREVWNKASAIGWHDDYHLVVADFDFSKTDDYSAEDVTFGFDDKRPHLVESKTDGNMHFPVLVEDLSEARAATSDFGFVDVKGSGAFAAPSWTVSIFTEGYTDFWRTYLGLDEHDVFEDTFTPVIKPTDFEDIVKLDGETVLRECDRDQSSDYNGQDFDTGNIRELFNGLPVGERVAHPLHGSDTGANFMLDEGGQTFRCWRCGVTGNAMHLLGIREGLFDGKKPCREAVNSDGEKRREMRELAIDEGLIDDPSVELDPNFIPSVRNSDKSDKRDGIKRDQARQKTREFFADIPEGGHVYESPQSLGKTRFATHGSTNHPIGIITVNKDEHRKSVKHFAGEAGASHQEVINFKPSDDRSRPGSWLWDNAPEPQRDEIHKLYRMGFEPRIIHSWYSDLIPEGVTDPYMSQFDSDIKADVLMMSPGHERVSAFNSFDDTKRNIIYDDVNPLVEQVSENVFTIESHEYGEHNARPELDLLIRQIDELESDTLSQLLDNQDDRETAASLVIGEPDEEQHEDNIFDELERRADLDEATRIDLVDIALQNDIVTRETLTRLLCVIRAERDDYEWVHFTKETDDGPVPYYTYYSAPDLHDHNVVLTSGSVAPGTAEHWLSECGHNPETHQATDDPRAIFRFQNLTAVQLSKNANSRSGGADADRRRQRTQTIRDAIERVEGQTPALIDAKKMMSDEDFGVNFARTRSNNDYDTESTGLVAGSTYYGDTWVQALAASMGRHVDIEHDGRAQCQDPVGSALLRYMREEPVGQAIARFGRRDGISARVYVDTCFIPDYIPTVDASDEVDIRSDSELSTFEAIQDGVDNYKQLANDGRTEYSTRQQARNIVEKLTADGLVTVEEVGFGAHGVSAEDESIEINIVELPEKPQQTSTKEKNARTGEPEDGDEAVQATLGSALIGFDPPS